MVVHLTDGYRASLETLFARTTGATRLGLERTRALLARLGDPHLSLPALHLAGTNGKGSVAATLEALLHAKGLRVGKYVSPHLIDFSERISVGGQTISADDVVDFVDRMMPDIERTGATFFEATTAMAFEHFARCRVDVAVIETGLGGRLDATNVCVPVAAAVTTIGLDHTEYLGGTLEQIAREKAGIFKEGAPAVIGEPAPAMRDLLAVHARAAGVSSIRVVAEESAPADIRVDEDGTAFTMRLAGAERRVRTPLAGLHQAANVATALVMLDAAGGPCAIPLDVAAHWLPRVRLAGRFQRLGHHILDVAHNADGARVLARTLALVAPERPRAALLCVLADKDWRGMMHVLAPEIDHFVITQAPTAPASRAWSPWEALEFARSRAWSAEVVTDFDLALARADACGATIVVTGSFHTVGDALARLQGSPTAG